MYIYLVWLELTSRHLYIAHDSQRVSWVGPEDRERSRVVLGIIWAATIDEEGKKRKKGSSA